MFGFGHVTSDNLIRHGGFTVGSESLEANERSRMEMMFRSPLHADGV